MTVPLALRLFYNTQRLLRTKRVLLPPERVPQERRRSRPTSTNHELSEPKKGLERASYAITQILKHMIRPHMVTMNKSYPILPNLWLQAILDQLKVAQLESIMKLYEREVY